MPGTAYPYGCRYLKTCNDTHQREQYEELSGITLCVYDLTPNCFFLHFINDALNAALYSADIECHVYIRLTKNAMFIIG